VQEEVIEEVGIDKAERLYLRPALTSFDYIHRAGMEVSWDQAGKRLFTPKPRQWTHLDWFRQIIAAVAGEYGVALELSPSTIWSNVPEELRTEIEAAALKKT
jgi:hypothetical protein